MAVRAVHAQRAEKPAERFVGIKRLGVRAAEVHIQLPVGERPLELVADVDRNGVSPSNRCATMPRLASGGEQGLTTVRIDDKVCGARGGLSCGRCPPGRNNWAVRSDE